MTKRDELIALGGVGAKVRELAGSANDDEAELARALLDQFEIRRK